MLVTKPSAMCTRKERRARERARASLRAWAESEAVVSAALVVSACAADVLVAADEGGCIRVDNESWACALTVIVSPASASSARFRTRRRGVFGGTREIYQTARNALSSRVKVAGGPGDKTVSSVTGRCGRQAGSRFASEGMC